MNGSQSRENDGWITEIALRLARPPPLADPLRAWKTSKTSCVVVLVVHCSSRHLSGLCKPSPTTAGCPCHAVYHKN